MSWLELDDGILDHPKFIRAVKLGGSDTVFMWLGLRAYCGKLLTDGFVPGDMLDEVRGPKDSGDRAKAIEVLVTVGLLERDGSGVKMHNYLKWSRSRADVLESRRKNAERQAKSRGSHTVSNAVTASVTNAAVTPSVTLPSPLLSSPLLTTPEEKREVAVKPARPKPWKFFPRDFVPDDSHRKLASDLGVSLAAALAEIQDHEFRDPKTDPGRTLSRWIRQAAKYSGKPQASQEPLVCPY